MFVQDRHAAILEHLSRRPRFPADELQEALGVSRSTLRRDLLELEEQGQLLRVHGGVMSPQLLRGESTFDQRSGEDLKAKRRIAVLAAEMVPAHATVYLDAGTTCLEVGKALLNHADLKIFTHSIPLLAAACEAGAKASVVGIGGELRAVSGALVGGLAGDWLGRLRFDFCFIAASGLDAKEGVSTTEVSEAAVKSSLLNRSQRCVLVADVGKCGHPAAVTFADWSRFETWVTDRVPPSGFRRVVKDNRVASSMSRR